ncbi:MAG: pilus assembly protein PilM [Phycisphaerae bacterium]|nr:pilus assembly protein PilM [Phycisphaerae bacterium]
MPAHVAPKKTLPIGVELGSSAAKLVQLKGTSEGVELSAFGAVTIPPILRGDLSRRLAFLSEQLPIILKSERFKGRKCIFALPAENSFVRHVRVRLSDTRSLESAVRRVARDELPYPVHDAVLRHIVAGNVHRNGEAWKEVIVVAVPNHTMDAYLTMTSRAGLEVVGVNVEPIAIVECFTGLFDLTEPADRAVLYLDLGYDGVQVIIARGQHLVFARNLLFSNDRAVPDLDKSTAAEISLTPVEENTGGPPPLTEAQLQEICEEIEKCLRYYAYTFHAEMVDRLLLTGDRAVDGALCRRLAQGLNLTAQMGDPLRGLQGAKQMENGRTFPPCPGLAIGVGLSLAGRDM